MNHFKKTTHLSEIIEKSDSGPVIIFIDSSDCNASTAIYQNLKSATKNKTIALPVYLVIVQEMPVLSRKIEEFFGIKHESPQILILNRGKVVYTAHHNDIKPKNFAFQ